MSQKGVTVIITFFIMVIILAIVLGVTAILFNEIKIASNSVDSVYAYYAAESGLEKTLYFDRKQIPNGASRGFCNICNVCSSGNVITPILNCNSCTATIVNNDATGCNPSICNDCQVQYTSNFNTNSTSPSYSVNGTVTPSGQNTAFNLTSKGSYLGIIREIELQSSQ